MATLLVNAGTFHLFITKETCTLEHAVVVPMFNMCRADKQY